MEEKYIQIFSKSSFQELTNDEKSFISELCSNEEEFENENYCSPTMIPFSSVSYSYSIIQFKF